MLYIFIFHCVTVQTENKNLKSRAEERFSHVLEESLSYLADCSPYKHFDSLSRVNSVKARLLDKVRALF